MGYVRIRIKRSAWDRFWKSEADKKKDGKK